MNKDRTVIHKVPVYSIEGLLGLKDENLITQNSSEKVIQKQDSVEQKESPSATSSPELDKLSRKGKFSKLYSEICCCMLIGGYAGGIFVCLCICLHSTCSKLVILILI